MEIKITDDDGYAAEVYENMRVYCLAQGGVGGRFSRYENEIHLEISDHHSKKYSTAVIFKFDINALSCLLRYLIKEYNGLKED